MIRLLRFLTWRHFRRHRLRTFLTFLGIALGVAVIVAINIVNRSLMGSFYRTIDLIAGKAVLQVVNGESGVRESLFPTIRDTRGVKDAAPSVEGFLPVVGFKGERLFVYGVDLLSDFSIREHQFVGDSFDLDAALDFLARPDSIALTESFSRRLGFPLGSKITLSTSRGILDYTVRALLKEQGTAKVFGGNFALMDLPVAQITFGKEGKLDNVDLTVEDGSDIETVRRRLEERVQGAAQVQRPDERGEQIESLLTSFRVGLFFVSLIAIFVGFFLIYNTVSVSVIQRKREIGTLRCLGVLRRNILIFFVMEVLLLALCGSLLGVLLGVLLAQGALAFVGQTVTQIFFQIDLTRSPLSLNEFWIALGCGLGVSILSALYPAWEAARVSPLESYRQAAWTLRGGGVFRATWLGVAFLVVVPFLLFFPVEGLGNVGRFSQGVVAMLVFLLGLSFLSPLLVVGWVRLLHRFLSCGSRSSRFSWIEARLACDSLRRSPVRSGITVSTLMISLAAIFTIATFVHSVQGSLLSWVDQMVTADLIIHSGARTSGPSNVPLKEEVGEKLRTIPGVRLLDFYRLIRSSYKGQPIVIESFSARASREVRNLPTVEGEAEKVLEQMAAGEGIVVSESFRSRFGKGRGNTIHLPTPSGLMRFKIVGVYVDYSSDVGSILIDRALYKDIWHDKLVDAFDLWLAPDADPTAVVQRIKEKYGETYQLFVSTHRELRESVVDIMKQSFNVNYAVEIVAVVVAIFSVINTLLASVLDRTREIGVLRAIGAHQRQIWRMVVAEAGWMGFMGGILGLFAGTIMSYHHVVYNTKVLTGWTFQYHYPLGIALLSLIVPVILCLLAGYFPARQAASTPIVTAIGYE